MFQTHDASCLSCHHGPHARPCGFKDSNHLNSVFLFNFFLSIEPGKVLANVSCCCQTLPFNRLEEDCSTLPNSCIHHDMVTMCHIESQYYHWTLSSGQVTYKEIRKIGTAEQLWEQQWLSGLQHIKSPNWLCGKPSNKAASLPLTAALKCTSCNHHCQEEGWWKYHQGKLYSVNSYKGPFVK